MVTPAINENGILNDAARELITKNCTMPDVARVIYNVGTKAYQKIDPETGKRITENGKPVMNDPVKVLTTVVFFADGTKVTVTNSEKDGVKFIKVNAVDNDSNSPVVEIADDTSKEMGLVYAICKRIFGKIGRIDKQGKLHEDEIDGDGFGRKLHDVVNHAYDYVREDAANKHNKKLAKAKYEASKGTSKCKRPSFADTVIDFKDAVNGLKEMIEVLKADLASAKA